MDNNLRNALCWFKEETQRGNKAKIASRRAHFHIDNLRQGWLRVFLDFFDF